VVKGDRARPRFEGDLGNALDHARSDRTDELAVDVVVQEWSPVASENNEQTTMIDSHVVDDDASG
jgi:hypothetical protein